MRETIASLERLGLRPRLYALASATQGEASVAATVQWIDTSRQRLACTWARVASHVHRLAISPIRYVGAFGRAALYHRTALGEFSVAVRLATTLCRDGIVHLHACDSASSSVAEAVARLTGMRFSMSMPSTPIDDAGSRSLKRSLTAAHFTIAPTNATLQAAKAIAPRAVLHRAYPGVDYRRYSPKLRGRPASVPLLLAVGEPHAQWDLGPLVEACRLLVARGLTLRCEVVGAVRELPRMQAQIERCGMHACMRLVGPLSDSQLMERYARAAVFVQVPCMAAPGSLDGIPTGLLEAMAMGLPLVAVRSPATEECVTHASNGLLVRSSDAAQLSEAIGGLLVRPRLGERLGKQARETIVERFDNDVNLRTLQRLLEEAARCATLAPNRAFSEEPKTHGARTRAIRYAAPPHRRRPPELHHA